MRPISEIKTFSTILIVDDSKENLFSISKILESQCYNLECASSGNEALKKVLKKDYALILLDVQMPEMNGYEVAEALKGAKKTKNIPIIFLTALSKEKKLVKTTDSGPVDYVEKPFDTDLLFMKINNFLRINYQARAIGKILEENNYLREKLNLPEDCPVPLSTSV